MKASLQVTILTATELFVILLLIPFASSIEASIDIPDEMFPHSEVEVSVSTPEESQYDIKIFFEDAKGEISGEIETSEGWKNTRFYIQDITFKIETFKVRLKDASTQTDNLNICVRLRESSSTSTPTKQCSAIDVHEVTEDTDAEDKTEEKEENDDNSEENQEEEQTESDEQEEKEDKTDKSNKPESKTPSPNPPSQQVQQEISQKAEEILDESPILLRKKQVEVEYTGRGKSRIIINYLLALVVLIALFLILKREQRYREI